MKRILITRAPRQASPLADALRARGFKPMLIPTIELVPPTTYAPLDAAIATLLDLDEARVLQGLDDATSQVPQGFSLGSHSQAEGEGVLTPAFHWLIFTSANAVEAFANRLALKGTGFSPSVPSATDRVPQGFSLGSHSLKEGRGVLTPKGSLPKPRPLNPAPCLIASIGPATSRAITELLGTQPSLTPEKAIAESLAEALLPHAKQPDGTPTRFLLVRAETARDILPETLQRAGGEVTIAPAYRTVIPQDSIPLIRTLFHNPETYPDAITFTSSSTATNLLALLEAAELSLPPHIPRISIGPITSQTLREAGMPPHAESEEPHIKSLVDKIVESIT